MGFLRASTLLFTLLMLSACGGQGQLDDDDGRDGAGTTLAADAATSDATTLQDGARAAADGQSALERDASGAASDAGDGAMQAASPSRCPELANTNPWEDLTGTRSLADRGQVLACAHVATFTQSQVANGGLFPSSIGEAVAGYDLFVVQYLSEGTPGTAQAVTALFYLPTGDARQLPIAAVSHPTTGMGPTCGPTHDSTSTDQIAVPLVGLGYAVVATDYAGMGIDSGMKSYLIGDSEAAANLDAVRALRRFQDPRFDRTRLGIDFFVLGHSQGGHAALFTQQQFDTSLGVRLLGSVSFAPGLGSAFAFSQGFNDASTPNDALATFGAMALYARMLYAGRPDASKWLSASAQALLPGWFHDQCVPGVGFTVLGRFSTQGDLYQSAFLQAAKACTFRAPCADFEPWSTALIAEQPGAFTSAAPALIMQGDADTLVLPATTACIVQRLSTHGTPVQACSYPGDTHTTIVGSALVDALRWMSARRTGTTPNVCPAPLTDTCAGSP
jgi:alpha-beta hydrolase superfamily lysophospholipase